jgi:hypothetical protein
MNKYITVIFNKYICKSCLVLTVTSIIKYFLEKSKLMEDRHGNVQDRDVRRLSFSTVLEKSSSESVETFRLMSLDASSRSCHRNQIFGCFFVRNIRITTAENDPSLIVTFLSRNTSDRAENSFTDTRYYFKCLHFCFLFFFFCSNKNTKILKAPSMLLIKKSD